MAYRTIANIMKDKVDPFLYGDAELDALRTELLESYKTPRNHVQTRDEQVEEKRIQVFERKFPTTPTKQIQADEERRKIRQKQEALKALYKTNKTEEREKVPKQTKYFGSSSSSISGSGSTHDSYHELYVVIKDQNAQLIRSKAKTPQETSGMDTERPATSSSGSSDFDMHPGQKMKIDHGHKKKSKEGQRRESQQGERMKPHSGRRRESYQGQESGPHQRHGREYQQRQESRPSQRHRGEPSFDQDAEFNQGQQKQLSKFMLKGQRHSKPPAFMDEEIDSDRKWRKDARLSHGHNRYSFDVDVEGPFFHVVKTGVKSRTVGIQVMMADVELDDPLKRNSAGSQTELEAGESKAGSKSKSISKEGEEEEETTMTPTKETDESQETGAAGGDSKKVSTDQSGGSEGARRASDSARRSSEGARRASDGSRRGSDSAGRESGDGLRVRTEDESEGGEESHTAASEAELSSSVIAGWDKTEEDELKGKTLERKESKRRDAETYARPVGYKDLNLDDEIAFVCYEAETYVTSYDLEKEQAKQRGIYLPRDNILWPLYSEFSIERATVKIEDYIKRCWTLDPKWMFVVQHLHVSNDCFRKKYVFEVKFSVPTPSAPVPTATASVFFVIEIPVYTEKDDTVKVSYVVEGSRFTHGPGKIPFQDKWLWAIIADKLRIQKAVNI